MTPRENYLRNARRQGPEWMPCHIGLSSASRRQLGPESESVMAKYPLLFPGFQPGQWDYERTDFGLGYTEGQRFTDNWACEWDNAIGGLQGVAVGHPLADWAALEGYQAPDPRKELDFGPIDWDAVEAGLGRARRAGEPVHGGVAHGFLFMRLTYLRGFENLMIDLATDDPHLPRLIQTVQTHNEWLVRKYLELGVDAVIFGEDLGTQTASIVSPRDFARWFTPEYRRLMQPCREAGALVYLHSDGYIMELMDEFVTAGVDIINPQDLCNGIDDLAREVKGRMTISLDVDRQTVVPFGTPREIEDLIEEEVRKLGSPEGGLELVCGVYPPTPIENFDAVCRAMMRMRTFWAG